MKAPAFWYEDRGALARLLRPAAALYGAIAAQRMSQTGARVKAPVVTIGNFVVGGAGKTPAAIAIAQMLIEKGARPAFLSRGYGGRLSGGAPVRVDSQSAADVGDEPLLLARVAPTYVGADREAAAGMAMADGADTLVLDDGLQSRRLEPDLAIAVVDAETGVGNGLCLPAGPLRAPLDVQMQRVQALVLVAEGGAGDAILVKAKQEGVAVFRARIEIAGDQAPWRGRRVVAFAGIGRPEKFFGTLRAVGARIVAQKDFPDHHAFSAGEIVGLSRLAREGGAELVTTEKDFARLAPEARADIVTLPVRLAIEPSFQHWVKDRLAQRR